MRVFRGELQTIHDLLYKSQAQCDEETLEPILANLAICLHSLVEMSGSRSVGDERSATLDAELRAIANLAREICGECVPWVYASALKESLDQIQELARKIAR